MATSMRTYNMMHLPGLLLPVPLSPGQATFDPCFCRRSSTGWSDSVSSCVTVPFPWVLVHTGFCLCPPRVKFLFPPVLCKSCNQIPLVFKVRFPNDSQSVCQIPRLGSLIWGIGPSQQWENFLDIIVLEIAGNLKTHLANIGFDFIVFAFLLPSDCGFLFNFGYGISLCVCGFQHSPVNVC